MAGGELPATCRLGKSGSQWYLAILWEACIDIPMCSATYVMAENRYLEAGYTLVPPVKPVLPVLPVSPKPTCLTKAQCCCCFVYCFKGDSGHLYKGALSPGGTLKQRKENIQDTDIAPMNE